MMGLYDVITEISQSNITKTETGENRITGVIVGQVVKNYEKTMPGRVCVRIPTRGIDTKGDTLKWARVATPYIGKEWGQYFLPEIGDEVLLIFEGGNIDKPYVIGAIPRDNGTEKSKVLAESADEHNTKKTIKTLHGSHITFVDSDDEKGKKGEMDSITVETAGKTHRVVLDNNKKQITLSDEKGKNSIVMDTDPNKNNITVKCAGTFTVEVDGQKKLKLILNGSTGTCTLEAENINIKATTGDIKADATKNIKLTANASASVSGGKIDVSSQGVTKIAGATVVI